VSDDAQAVVVKVAEAVGSALDQFHLAVEPIGSTAKTTGRSLVMGYLKGYRTLAVDAAKGVTLRGIGTLLIFIIIEGMLASKPHVPNF